MLTTGATGDMESDLKNLQSKIMDLENKLSFTHTVLNDEGFELNQNVQINPTAFHSLTTQEQFENNYLFTDKNDTKKIENSSTQ